MSISLFAYHGQPELRQIVIDHISHLASLGYRSNTTNSSDHAIGFLEALADGSSDPAVAFQKTGFPYPLLQICESIFKGLPTKQAAAFAVELVQTAQIDADISDVAFHFLEWMIEDSLSTHGRSGLQSSAKDKGPVLTKLAQMQCDVSSAAIIKKLTRQAKRHDLPIPTSDEKFVHDALHLVLGGGSAGSAVDWIADLAPDPEAKYALFARKIIELVKTT